MLNAKTSCVDEFSTACRAKNVSSEKTSEEFTENPISLCDALFKKTFEEPSKTCTTGTYVTRQTFPANRDPSFLLPCISLEPSGGI